MGCGIRGSKEARWPCLARLHGMPLAAALAGTVPHSPPIVGRSAKAMRGATTTACRGGGAKVRVCEREQVHQCRASCRWQHGAENDAAGRAAQGRWHGMLLGYMPGLHGHRQGMGVGCGTNACSKFAAPQLNACPPPPSNTHTHTHHTHGPRTSWMHLSREPNSEVLRPGELHSSHTAHSSSCTVCGSTTACTLPRSMHLRG